MKKILTAAGYDPSSGAGITKDLDIFFSLGIHGIGVPTCIVIQGPQGVSDIYPIPVPHFAAMLEKAPGEGPVDGLKIGVVRDKPYVDEIKAFLARNGKIPVVVDPVATSKNNRKLNTDAGFQELIRLIFPVSDIVTPNIDEASMITGMEITDGESMKEAARRLADMGPRAVVVKGGHLRGAPVDVLYDGKEFLLREKTRIDRQVHGTGCAFSALLLSFLVLGYPLKDAFLAAEESMDKLITSSYRIDKGGYFYMATGVVNVPKTL
jgi:hydroxymethylpyrimidine kinase/phosphomethylpyrimidine kinase